MATFSSNALNGSLQNTYISPSEEALIEADFGEEIAQNIEQFLHHFERAEYSLGHALDNPDAINKAFLSSTENVISISDHHNFQYSLKETSHEQDSAGMSGDGVDKNFDTEIGRLKIGIRDSESSAKKDSIRAYRNIIAQALITEQEQLAAQIRELRAEIVEIEEHLAEIDEAQQALEDGDINDNSTSGAARRRTVETALARQGRTLDDYRQGDGSIDQEAVNRALAEERVQQEIARQARQDALDNAESQIQKLEEQKQQEIEAAFANGDTKKIEEFKQDASNNKLRIETITPEEGLSVFAATDEDMLVSNNSNEIAMMFSEPLESNGEAFDFDTDFNFEESDDIFFSEDTDAPSSEIAHSESSPESIIEPINVGRSYGSFASEGFDGSAISTARITDTFSAASVGNEEAKPKTSEFETPLVSRPTVSTAAFG
ncbi:MAG: hypothetical protein ACRBDI_08390 [Alphaproteobacteria bacterium]